MDRSSDNFYNDFSDQTRQIENVKANTPFLQKKKKLILKNYQN